MNLGTQEVKTGAEVVSVAVSTFGEIANLVFEVASQVEDTSVAMEKMVEESRNIVQASEKSTRLVIKLLPKPKMFRLPRRSN